MQKVIYKCGCGAAGDLVAPHCPIHGDQVKTKLGKELLSIRNKAIEKGMILLTEDEVLDKVKKNRAG